MKISKNTIRYIFLSSDTVRSVLICLAFASSANAEGDIFLSCAQKYPGDDAGRLKCYDQQAIPKGVVPDHENEAHANTTAAPARSAESPYLTRAWNLDDQFNRDPSQLGRLQPYRQSYMLVNRTSHLNRQPDSPAIAHNTPVPKDIDASEVKFQLSFKADIGSRRDVDFLGIKTLRLWGAYTQQSYWQTFNIRNSTPFRETVYEPELIATLGTANVSGLKLVNIGWVHQSNGRSLPDSRGWNRIYLQGGLEWNDTTSVLVRGWRRIQNNPSTDDNPDIGDYLGRGDLVIRWEPGDKSQSIALLLRNNLKGTNNRGYEQIDWATPVKFGNAARMHMQMTSGYGASLIDYNHRQTTLGLGFSFREW